MIEMLIVVTIVMVVGTFALMIIGDSQAHLDRQGIAREFKISLERARYDSVKRNVSKCEDMSRVVIEGPNTFTVMTDQNGDGSLDVTTEARTVDFGEPRGIEIVYDLGIAFPITIRFDRKGNSTSGPCTSTTPATTPTIFCTLPCTSASANKENSTIVYVSPTGTTAYLTGGSRMPSITAPALDLLDSSNQINPGLAVWDPTALIVSPSPIGTPAATPTATPSPTVTPSPTPIPTASASPNPTTTPTPSSTPAASPAPTPSFCLLGEQPAINQCICSPLQYLQASSGKCRAL